MCRFLTAHQHIKSEVRNLLNLYIWRILRYQSTLDKFPRLKKFEHCLRSVNDDCMIRQIHGKFCVRAYLALVLTYSQILVKHFHIAPAQGFGIRKATSLANASLLHLTPLFRMTHSEVCCSVWHKKTKMIRLPCGEKAT